MSDEEKAKLKELLSLPQEADLLSALFFLRDNLQIPTDEALKNIIDSKIDAWNGEAPISFYFGKIRLSYKVLQRLIRYYIGHTEGYSYDFYFNLEVGESIIKQKERVLKEDWLIYNEQDEAYDEMKLRLKKRIATHALTILADLVLPNLLDK